MRKSIDGLMAIIRDTFEMDAFANAIFLFCGRSRDRIKALHFEKTGFVLLYKRLDNNSSNKRKGGIHHGQRTKGTHLASQRVFRTI